MFALKYLSVTYLTKRKVRKEANISFDVSSGGVCMTDTSFEYKMQHVKGSFWLAHVQPALDRWIIDLWDLCGFPLARSTVPLLHPVAPLPFRGGCCTTTHLYTLSLFMLL